MLYENMQVQRVLIPDKPGAFGRLATAIGDQGANLGDVRGAALAVDGKSVNNALAFPGLFRGVMDAGVPHFSTSTLLAVAEVLSSLAQPHELVPSVLAPGVHEAVRKAAFEASLQHPKAPPHVLA